MAGNNREARRGVWGMACQSGTVYHPRGRGVRYWLCGEAGPALLLCNGLCSGPDLWAPLVKALQRSHRLLLWEYPGQGMSTAVGLPGHTVVRALARDARLLLDGVGIDRSVVVGQGVGVQVAVEMMSLDPRRVLGVVGICGTAGGLLSGFVPPLLGPILERMFHGLMALPGIPAWKVLRALDSAGGLPSGGRRSDPGQDERPGDIRSGSLETLSRADPHTGLRLLASMLFHHPTRHPGRTTTPVLWLAGERDRVLSPRRCRRMAGLHPGSRLVFLPGCSHRALPEDPECVLRHVRAFLQEHGLG